MTRLLATAAIVGATVFASTAGSMLTGAPAHAQEGMDVDVAELMKQGTLEDIVLGNADAKVTIVEYMSLTCPHCAAFHKETFPKLREKYIDTGKVNFVLREFPLDQVAWAGAMLARCVDKSKFYPVIDVLMEKQLTWARSPDPAGELFKIFKQAGMTKDQFDACRNDRDLAQNVISVRERASKDFRVDSTPTFFINGKILNGEQKIEEFDKLIEPLL